MVQLKGKCFIIEKWTNLCSGAGALVNLAIGLNKTMNVISFYWTF